MEPIGTIESGDEIEYFDESEDELEEKVYSAKDRKETAGVFTEGQGSTEPQGPIGPNWAEIFKISGVLVSPGPVCRSLLKDSLLMKKIHF